MRTSSFKTYFIRSFMGLALWIANSAVARSDIFVSTEAGIAKLNLSDASHSTDINATATSGKIGATWKRLEIAGFYTMHDIGNSSQSDDQTGFYETPGVLVGYNAYTAKRFKLGLSSGLIYKGYYTTKAKSKHVVNNNEYDYSEIQTLYDGYGITVQIGSELLLLGKSLKDHNGKTLVGLNLQTQFLYFSRESLNTKTNNPQIAPIETQSGKSSKKIKGSSILLSIKYER